MPPNFVLTRTLPLDPTRIEERESAGNVLLARFPDARALVPLERARTCVSVRQLRQHPLKKARKSAILERDTLDGAYPDGLVGGEPRPSIRTHTSQELDKSEMRCITNKIKCSVEMVERGRGGAGTRSKASTTQQGWD